MNKVAQATKEAGRIPEVRTYRLALARHHQKVAESVLNQDPRAFRQADALARTLPALQKRAGAAILRRLTKAAIGVPAAALAPAASAVASAPKAPPAPASPPPSVLRSGNPSPNIGSNPTLVPTMGQSAAAGRPASLAAMGQLAGAGGPAPAAPPGLFSQVGDTLGAGYSKWRDLVGGSDLAAVGLPVAAAGGLAAYLASRRNDRIDDEDR